MNHERLPTEGIIGSLEKMTYFDLARAIGLSEKGAERYSLYTFDRFRTMGSAMACMIGDSTSDIRHARQAGVRSIAATWGWQSREKLVGENPDFVADNVRDLAALLNAGDLLSTTHR